MNPTFTAAPATRCAATHATTMKAIVQAKYGSPHVLKLGEIDTAAAGRRGARSGPRGGGQHGRLDRPDGQAVRGAPRVRAFSTEASGSGNCHGRAGGCGW